MLYVIATPIGNLSDLSSRALQVLNEVQIVLCEDTRETQKLLFALGLKLNPGKLQRLDQHSTEATLNHWIAELEKGVSVALVSDAGTPGINDPGSALVRKAYENGFQVSPIPGPSALTAFVSASGSVCSRIFFRGFFPREKKEQQVELKNLKKLTDVATLFVWFESPHRLKGTFENLLSFEENELGQWIFAKEITKIHETFIKGTLNEISQKFQHLSKEDPDFLERGEWVMGYESIPVASTALVAESESSQAVLADAVLTALLEFNHSAGDIARYLSQSFGISKNEAYQKVLSQKKR